VDGVTIHIVSGDEDGCKDNDGHGEIVGGVIVERAFDDGAREAQAAIGGFESGEVRCNVGGEDEHEVGDDGTNDVATQLNEAHPEHEVAAWEIDEALKGPGPHGVHADGAAEKKAGERVVPACERFRGRAMGGDGAVKVCGFENDLRGGDPEALPGGGNGLFPEWGLAIDGEAFGDGSGAFGAEGIGGDAVDDVAAFFAEKRAFLGDSGSDAGHWIMVHLEIAEVRIQKTEGRDVAKLHHLRAAGWDQRL